MTADLLTSHQDKTVEGVYRLGGLIEASAEGAVYQTEYGPREQSALIELRPGDSPEAARLLAFWRKTLELSHPNLIRVCAAGNSTVDGVPVIYRVTERAEESLAGAIADRALSEDEAIEMVEPMLSALSYLHHKGYVHGGLDPSQVLAAGDTLKLSIASLAPEGEDKALKDDVWAAGAVLVEALTRVAPEPREDAAHQVPRWISEPLRETILHCLDADPERRWTADQAIAHMHPPLPQAAAVEYKRKDHRGLIFWLAAVLVVIAAAAVLTRRAEPTATPAAAAPVVAIEPAPVSPAPPVSVEPPSAPSPPAVAPRSTGRRADGWFVVVASYGARGPAEKRVHELEKKWPGFKVDMYEPPSERNHHLVVIGTNLSEDAAAALRKRAIASGLPRDTYIKRLAGD